MLGGVLATVGGAYALGTGYAYFGRELSGSAYPSPEAAAAEIDTLARAHPELCHLEQIGTSTEGRPVAALRLRAGADARPRLLITAQIHSVEFIGSYVARAVARRLVERYGHDPLVTDLLDRSEVWMVPLLNPDGAARIWRNGGWTTLGNSRFTANGVDPNRNFPFVEVGGRKAWNSGRNRPGSAYYCGPHPLSEPECLSLAQLCRRERFCAAINFHSFSGVVFMPLVAGAPWPDAAKAERVLQVFSGVFQAHQPHLRYRPIPERDAGIVGQLDPFLLNAFGTPSVTVEVSRPRLQLLAPWRLLHPFCWASPSNPDFWVENDADATIQALAALLDRSGGEPCQPRFPQLGEF